SAALLTALKAEGLIDRIGLAGGYAYMGSGEEGASFAHALREVFRKGEPHLASIDPALSRAYATSMIDFVNTARFDGAVPGNDILALSYLLHGSTLSTPFLAVVGKELEDMEKRFIQSGHSWAQATTAAKGMASLFPTEKAQAAFDPVASYMSALGNNPTAAHAFFTTGGEERVQYWVEKRRWGHDNFDGLLAALDAAITQGDNAGQPSSARLASSTIEYLANRTQGMDSAGNPLLFDNDDETFTPKTVGTTASSHLAHILGTHMLAMDYALDALKFDGTYAGRLTDPTRHDLDGIKDLPLFRRSDLEILTRVAVASDEGMGSLRRAVSTYQDAHFAHILREHHGKPTYDLALADALRTDARLESFFIDTIGEVHISAAQDEKQRAQAWIAGGKKLAGEIPVSKIPVLGNIASLLAEHTLQEVEHAALHSLNKDIQDAIEDANDLGQKALEARYAGIVGNFYDAGLIDPGQVMEFSYDAGLDPAQVDLWIRNGLPNPDGTAHPLEFQRVIARLAHTHFDPHGNYEQTYKDGFTEFFND
ncbi:DUF6571 family protein, partial [Schaalia canis]|uniref:DUF6571 family protein n=1 Tax=Schaalia canis TaxID=100469 RepID=UPI00196B6BD4